MNGKTGGDGIVNTSTNNVMGGGGNGSIAAGSAYNMTSYLSANGHDANNTSSNGLPPSRGIGTRKMMAAVGSGFIEEVSPHSSKHELLVQSVTGGGGIVNGAGIYRKRF